MRNESLCCLIPGCQLFQTHLLDKRVYDLGDSINIDYIMNVCYHSRVSHPLIARIDQTSDSLEARHLDVPPPHSVDGGSDDNEYKQDSKYNPDNCCGALVRITRGRGGNDRRGCGLSCCCP